MVDRLEAFYANASMNILLGGEDSKICSGSKRGGGKCNIVCQHFAGVSYTYIV
jgi:hypothetical protein